MNDVAIVKPVELNGEYLLVDKLGRTFKCHRRDDAEEFVKVNAKRNNGIRVSEKDGELIYRACNIDLYMAAEAVSDEFTMMMATATNHVEKEVMSDERKETIAFLNSAISLKPTKLKMAPIRWKYLVRSVIRGKNIMMVGPTGCGKTFAVQCLNVAFPERKLFSINLGATQDPRATLIGNTHFSKENGTYFAESQFVKAIQQEGTIVLLDELSRAHPEAMNILMTVLDEGQRYLRLDEADGAPTIKVAKGVSFIATANIGNEYTATRVLDRALIDRFTIIEMDVLTAADEKILLKEIYKELADRKINAIAEIAEATRNEMRTDSPKISTILSTRATVELAGLLNDGFTLAEAAEVAIFPFYTEDGGVDSERTFVKMIVQKYLDIDRDEDLFEIGDDLDDVTVQSTGLSNAKPF